MELKQLEEKYKMLILNCTFVKTVIYEKCFEGKWLHRMLSASKLTIKREK
jgi:hypothetical protein